MLASILTMLLIAPAAQPSTAPSPAVTMSAAPEAQTPSPQGERVPGRMPAVTATMPPIPAGAAVIRNSGSTNTTGYIIVISPDGNAIIRQNDENTNAVLARPQTQWLFAKLRQFAPLGALPQGHCMRSVSFGSSTTISYGGATTPGLSCAVSPEERELARTVGVIVRQLHVSTFPRHRLRIL